MELYEKVYMFVPERDRQREGDRMRRYMLGITFLEFVGHGPQRSAGIPPAKLEALAKKTCPDRLFSSS